MTMAHCSSHTVQLPPRKQDAPAITARADAVPVVRQSLTQPVLTAGDLSSRLGLDAHRVEGLVQRTRNTPV